MSKSAKVVIIGAGVSGLKAAEVLLSSGKLDKNDLLILEAQDRVGGRLQDTKIEDSKLGIKYALGALWYHDTLANTPLRDLQEKGLVKVGDVYYDDLDAPTFTKDGVLDVSSSKLNRALEEASQFFPLFFNDETPDLSCDEVVTEYIKAHEKLLTEEQKEYLNRGMRLLEIWHGIPSVKASGRMALLKHEGRNLLNKKGFTFLIDTLKKEIPDSCFLLKQPVRSITQEMRAKKSIMVETKNGLTVETDFLIVTVPLSILKLDSNDEYGITWSPPLPKPLKGVIDNLGFAALGKVFFEFDRIWWDNKEERFQVFPNKVEASEVDHALEKLPPPFTFPALVVNYAKLYPNKLGSSLAILTPSPLTNYLESHPNEAWTYFKPMLEKIAIKPIEDPVNTLVTDWTKNPFIRGSYTAIPAETADLALLNAMEHESLGLEGSNIRFAGEHTVLKGTGCVHGAYDSGIREADWVLNALLKPSLKL